LYFFLNRTRDYSGHIIETLDAGIRVLIYVGEWEKVSISKKSKNLRKYAFNL
jgi:hypothetical protein